MTNRKHYILPLAAVLSVAAAYSFRFLFQGTILTLLARAGIYIILYILWGISVYRRSTQNRIRQIFIAITVLMVFWMTVRTIKYLLPDNSAAARYCWYLFYIGMLFLPLLATEISVFLGRPEGYRPPVWLRWLYIAAGALFLFVFTNDLHQLVFIFPEGKPFTTLDYDYGPGFVPIAVWMYSGLIATLFLIFTRSRLPGRGRRLLAPIIPAGLLVGYHLCYLLEFPWLRVIFGDLTATECVLVICILEACLSTGLIPSNTRYAELFAAAEISALITDTDYQVQYSSGSAVTLPKELMCRTKQGAVMLDKKTQLQGMDVTGGHVLWTTDLTELIALWEKLEMTKEELAEANEILQHEYEEEQAYRRIVEQNRLYDALQGKTQSQIDQISDLADAYCRADSAKEKREILSRIIFLGSFVKRRKDFVLSMAATPFLPESRLQNAFAESYRALSLMNIRGSFLVETGQNLVQGKLLTDAYDFFEDFIETAVDSLCSVSVIVRPVNAALRVSILADCGDEICALKERYPQAKIKVDEDGVTAVLPLEGGLAS